MADASVYAAFVKLQQDLPKIGKDKTAKAGAYSYKYASLNSILDAVTPAIHKHGFALRQAIISLEDRTVLKTELLHKDGGIIDGGQYLLSVRDANDPQAMGSAITYARRYALTALLGIAPDDDDDGQAAQATKPAAKKQEPIGPERAVSLHAIIENTGIKAPTQYAAEVLGRPVKTLAELNERDAKTVYDSLSVTATA